jgi:hypothetical protein
MLRRAAWPSRTATDAYAGARRDVVLQQAHNVFFTHAGELGGGLASVIFKEVPSR